MGWPLDEKNFKVSNTYVLSRGIEFWCVSDTDNTSANIEKIFRRKIENESGLYLYKNLKITFVMLTFAKRFKTAILEVELKNYWIDIDKTTSGDL